MFLRSRKPIDLLVDLHSHIVPGVDDGAKKIADSMKLITSLVELGYKKLIVTPHISETYYPNDPEKLKEGFQNLLSEVSNTDLNINIQLGAEYMVDGMLLSTLKSDGELLSWNGHLLFETSFHNKPMILDETIFEIQRRGLIPVYAHPERYPYYFKKWDQLQKLRDRGVLLQVNLGSISGMYGKEVSAMAKSMIKKGLVDLLGSDLHNTGQLKFVSDALRSKVLKSNTESFFRNRELLN